MWKYNKEKHCIQQETMEKPMFPVNPEVKDKLIPTLRSIPVQGTVEWKDGQQVIEGWHFIFNMDEVIPISPDDFEPISDEDKKPIIQEQPHKDHKIVSDAFIAANNLQSQEQPKHTQSEIITGYIHKIDSLMETNRKLGEKLAAQANKEAKEDDVEKLAEKYITDILYPMDQKYDEVLKSASRHMKSGFIAGYKAAQQQGKK